MLDMASSIDDDHAVRICSRSVALRASRSDVNARHMMLRRRAGHVVARTFTVWPNVSLPATSTTVSDVVMRNSYLDDTVDFLQFAHVPPDGVPIGALSERHGATQKGMDAVFRWLYPLHDQERASTS